MSVVCTILMNFFSIFEDRSEMRGMRKICAQHGLVVERANTT